MNLISTPRLKLIRVKKTDAMLIFAGWSGNQDNFLYLDYPFHAVIADAEKFVASLALSWDERSLFSWHIFSLAANKVIGIILASIEQDSATLGYVIDRAQSASGFATEAVIAVTEALLQQPGIARIWATCDIRNEASAKVLEKAGFECEGTLKQPSRNPLENNQVIDSYSYSKHRRTDAP